MNLLGLGLAMASISGDFDHDGLRDLAFLRTAAGVTELVVERATGEVVVIDRVENARNYYFGKLSPGNYNTACAKGLGSSKRCNPAFVRVSGDALQFGTREASQAVATWDGGKFKVQWLSD